jgi:hypothetical protein
MDGSGNQFVPLSINVEDETPKFNAFHEHNLARFQFVCCSQTPLKGANRKERPHTVSSSRMTINTIHDVRIEIIGLEQLLVDNGAATNRLPYYYEDETMTESVESDLHLSLSHDVEENTFDGPHGPLHTQMVSLRQLLRQCLNEEQDSDSGQETCMEQPLRGRRQDGTNEALETDSLVLARSRRIRPMARGNGLETDSLHLSRTRVSRTTDTRTERQEHRLDYAMEQEEAEDFYCDIVIPLPN